MDAKFEQNVGAADRVLRFVLGALAMGYTFVTTNNGEWLFDLMDLGLGIFGFTLVLSSILAHCWVYKIFGINTCTTEPS